MWFYVRDDPSSLPHRTAGPPVKKASWNSRGDRIDQVNFLLEEIEILKKEYQISGASVIAHWSLRRVQPLQQRIHLGFEYVEETNPSRYT